MTYNLTPIFQANDPTQILIQTNILAGGIVWISVLLLIFLSFIIANKGNSMKKAMLAGSFFIVLVSIYFFIQGFIGVSVLTVAILLLFANLILLYFGGE